MKPIFLILPSLIFLAACGGMTVPAQTRPDSGSPSPLPLIVSPTSPFVPSATTTPVEAASPTPSETPASTATPTLPPWSPTLLVQISGCNTSLDITHGMGEVTNAYPLLKNYTLSNLTNVCATLLASDEARVHPDKTACIPLLPAGNQVLLKLTVDTGFKADTSIQVDVASQEGQAASVTAASCRDLGFPGWIPDQIGVIEPIP